MGFFDGILQFFFLSVARSSLSILIVVMTRFPSKVMLTLPNAAVAVADSVDNFAEDLWLACGGL